MPVPPPQETFIRTLESIKKSIALTTFDATILKDGTDVAFTGFPLQTPLPHTSQGIVAGYGATATGKTIELVIDKNTWPGASGSPVYLKNGHIVGAIIPRGTNDATGLAFARTGNLVDRFLKAAR